LGKENEPIWKFALVIKYIIKYLIYLLCDPNIFNWGIIDVERVRSKVAKLGQSHLILVKEVRELTNKLCKLVIYGKTIDDLAV
jgi:hypothetical protein